MKKTKLFVFNVDNTIDLITNSSSELFILQGNTKEHVVGMIESAYPDYLTEYEEVKCIDELSNRELDTYISYNYFSWDAKSKNDLDIIPGLTFEEMYEIPAWAKSNPNNREERYYTKDVTDEMRERIINGLSPKKDMYFLFSLDENPDYDKQQQLEMIASRYHLG